MPATTQEIRNATTEPGRGVPDARGVAEHDPEAARPESRCTCEECQSLARDEMWIRWA
ncbi:MAG TPA: hypothetical protein VHR85_14725 [Nocardioides sp.]|jgi:hypothetical protein|nr:hypothetical protein [Nocardioides sp.]